MYTKTIMSLIALLLGLAVRAQEEAPGIRNLTKITVFSPGISYEARTGTDQILRGHAFAGVGLSYSFSSNLGSNFEIEVNPGIGLQYRFYYNAKARAAKGKRTGNNNLNYVAGFSQLTLSKALVTDSGNEVQPDGLRPVTSIGAVWGIQRNYPKHFSLDLSVGPGIYFTRAEYDLGGPATIRETISNFTLVGELTLGFWLNGNRKK